MKMSTAGLTCGSSLALSADMYDNALISTQVRNYYQLSNVVTAIKKTEPIYNELYLLRYTRTGWSRTPSFTTLGDIKHSINAVSAWTAADHTLQNKI